MEVFYNYKDRKFNDIRHITQNNILEPDIEYIKEEYLPFQTFISGRTFFKGLTIDSSYKYVPVISRTYKLDEFNYEFFKDSIEKYIKHFVPLFKASESFATVSGGTDSSNVALELNPPITYSGYYEGDEYDERKYAQLISEKIGSKRFEFLLDERLFLKTINEYIDILGVPIAGFGGVMEYLLLKCMVELFPETTYALFGNGGDEIFMSYYFNYYIKNFYEKGHEKPEIMDNFYPLQVSITDKSIDMIIIASLNRAYETDLTSKFVVEYFLPKLQSVKDWISKLLMININMTLSSLLHINNQICRANNVVGLNPLSNEDFIKCARAINSPMTDIPKKRLREVHPNIPVEIKNNMLKRGFPIPFKNWNELNCIMEDAHRMFFNRKEFASEKPYSGINRYQWAVYQAELFLEKINW